MSKRRPKHTQPVLSEQVRNALFTTLEKHLPLGIQGRALDDKKVWDILTYASVNSTTIETACNELADVPSGNTVREHLGAVLDTSRKGVTALENDLNEALKSQLSAGMTKRLGRKSYEVGIDLTENPYHGQSANDDNEIRRGKAKSGTTHFHAYATLSIVHHQRRYELALTFVWADESMEKVVQRLILQAKTLGLRIRRAYLDKGFCSKEVFHLLRGQRIAYLIPIPKRGKSGGIRALFVGRCSYHTHYTFNVNTERAYTTDVILICRYTKGRYGRHQVEWFTYAAWGMDKVGLHQVFDLYRRRFGMESGYRQMHQVRARTTSRNPALRLLLVGLALIIYNVYITLRRIYRTPRFYGGRVRRIWLTLKRMALLLLRIIERLLGVAPIEQIIAV